MQPKNQEENNSCSRHYINITIIYMHVYIQIISLAEEKNVTVTVHDNKTKKRVQITFAVQLGASGTAADKDDDLVTAINMSRTACSQLLRYVILLFFVSVSFSFPVK